MLQGVCRVLKAKTVMSYVLHYSHTRTPIMGWWRSQVCKKIIPCPHSSTICLVCVCFHSCIYARVYLCLPNWLHRWANTPSDYTKTFPYYTRSGALYKKKGRDLWIKTQWGERNEALSPMETARALALWFTLFPLCCLWRQGSYCCILLLL